MQEEVENRTLTLVVSGTKFTGRMFKAAINPLRDGLPFKKCSEILRMAWTLTIF